jgi:EAL domain-containing protein (putative c-di-GMP-specific phosphodiesterase class I)
VEDTCSLSETHVMRASPRDLATGTHSRAQALRHLIGSGEIATMLQPIVPLVGHGDLAFEILGRGARSELPPLPGPLFEIAEEAGLAGELSRCFRSAGLEAARTLPDRPTIYTNVHPAELDDDVLARDLAAFRERSPALPVTVEVHESTVTDPQAMQRLKARLADLDIRLAYDDFGAGQARLLELAECPPDCLKFDMSLIRDIDTAPASRQRLIESLVAIARDMGVMCLAEGIERAGELEACRCVGFEFAQGYFIARPATIEHWLTPWSWEPDEKAHGPVPHTEVAAGQLRP